MKIRSKYLIAFLSSTVFTFMVVGVALWGVAKLTDTTDYLVRVNSRVLELASAFEKDLAKSRRCEKEFFIFPNNFQKQEKYIEKWNHSYSDVEKHIFDLQSIFLRTGNKEMLSLLDSAKPIIQDNRNLFATVVAKYQKTKSYDSVNDAEYGTFKKKTHILEDTAAKIYKYGLSEVEKGRALFYKSQKQTRFIINSICIVAAFWGLFIPILLSRRLTSVILYLTKVSDNISRGKLKEEIMANRKDELGDLARSIKRMQKSLQIMMDRFARASA